MTNNDLLNLLNPREIEEETLKKISEIQERVIAKDNNDISLEDQLIMMGSAVQLNAILNPKTFTDGELKKYDEQFQEIWERWYQKNQDIAKMELVESLSEACRRIFGKLNQEESFMKKKIDNNLYKILAELFRITDEEARKTGLIQMEEVKYWLLLLIIDLLIAYGFFEVMGK